MRKIFIFPTAEKVAQAAADLIIQTMAAAIEKRGLFSLGLAGGSTPGRLYSTLSLMAYRDQMDWSKVHIFWGDERCVPPEDRQSNYRLAKVLLLDHVPLPPVNIHRMHGEFPGGKAADLYEKELQGFFGVKDRNSTVNMLDLLLLGLGEDGHTASLFPGSPALDVSGRRVIGVEHRTHPAPLVDRITLTLPAINASRHVVFLVTGESKASVLARVLEPPSEQPLLPASRVNLSNGDIVWLIDAAAASSLP